MVSVDGRVGGEAVGLGRGRRRSVWGAGQEGVSYLRSVRDTFFDWGRQRGRKGSCLS